MASLLRRKSFKYEKIRFSMDKPDMLPEVDDEDDDLYPDYNEDSEYDDSEE